MVALAQRDQQNPRFELIGDQTNNREQTNKDCRACWI